MATLYRKYRPQNFKEVVGQNHIKLILEHEIKSNKIAHAYIFCGPRAVGKTTLARVMAKAINCETRKKDSAQPCDKCHSCEEITQGRSLDVMEIDAASNTGVDNVRENIIANARVAPSKLKYKVFIIDEVHMLSISAFNALLKVIEEPPKYVIFILCTTEIHKVPATIISRCQRFDFRKISISDIVQKLTYIINAEKIQISREILEAIARQSEGHMRDAESLLGQIVSIGGKEITQEEADLVIPRSDLTEVVNLIDFLAKKDSAGGISLINRLVDEGVDLKIFLSNTIEMLRKIMLSKISPALTKKLSLELGESLEIKISQISQNLNVEKLSVFIERSIKARNELKGSFIIQLPIELAIVEICSVSAPPIVKQDNAVNVKQAATPAPAQSSAPASAPKNLEPAQFSEKWNEVLVKIKKYNHSLSFILRVCQPKELDGNKLCLVFKYKFHKDRVDEPEIKAIIEKVLREAHGTDIIVNAVVDENLQIANEKLVSNNSVEVGSAGQEKKEAPAPADENNNLVGNLLTTFGGKVVE